MYADILNYICPDIIKIDLDKKNIKRNTTRIYTFSK
jgi:hypothetical protein